MQRKFTILLFLLVLGFKGICQERFELTGLIGYATSSSYLKDYRAKFKIKHSMSYGGNIGVRLLPYTVLEISYHRQDTDLLYRPYSAPSEEFPISANYLQLGVLKEFLLGPLKPFGLFSLGPAWYSPKVSNLSSVWRFSTIFGAGLKYYPLGSKIGLRFQARLIVPWFNTNVGIWCNLGSGCAPNVGTSNTIVTGDFQGGIIVRLGEDVQNAAVTEW